MLQSEDFIFKTLEDFWTQTQQLSRNHNKLKSVKKCDFWEIIMPFELLYYFSILSQQIQNVGLDVFHCKFD